MTPQPTGTAGPSSLLTPGPGASACSPVSSADLASSRVTHEYTRQLGKREGLLVGVSSGAALACALKVAQKIESGVIVTVFPDAGDKYLSERFWDER